jgi:tetratricopeptide (TPR) repeat protein
LLAQDENNPMVLNALGYTMSLHSDRQEEAYQLIIKAYNLKPNSPAIIDSLGWVLFKLGQTREALSYLQKAYNMMADPEIAAHLGEVNWVLGNHETAVNIWIQALRQEPQHKAIIETVERLGVALRGIE